MKKFSEMLSNAAGSAVSFARTCAPVAVVAVAVIGASAMADTGSGSATIPDVGVDIKAYAESGLTYLGGFLGTIIGGTIAVIGIRAGVRWISSMLRGR